MATASKTRGRVLRDLRDARGISQTQLANAIGIKTQGTISAWELDKQDIEPENILKLARFFGVDPESIGYEVPQMVDANQVREWIKQASMEAEALASARHLEVMQALRLIHDKLGII